MKGSRKEFNCAPQNYRWPMPRFLPSVRKKKRLEQQLRQAQKMESMGTLASGIAHDFNNILNIIKGYASLLPQSGEEQQVAAEALQVIDETVERGAATVRQLLALARESNLQFDVHRSE